MLAVVLFLAYLPVTALNTFAKDAEFSGSGTESDPFVIEDAEGLISLETLVNNGEIATEDVYFALDADIDLTEEDITWVGIGNEEHPFAGYFDGQGHIVKGLYGTQGLFGHVYAASIQSVVVSGTVAAEGTNDVAGIVGCIDGDETNLSFVVQSGNVADVTVSGSEGINVGGVVGHIGIGASAMIIGCFNKGEITGYEFVGGIVGRTEGEELNVVSCYNAGAVTATHSNLSSTNTDAFAGGICSNTCKVYGCYNTGSITGYHYSSRTRRTEERGYAITGGTPELDLVFWLEGSADRGTGASAAERPASSSEEAFTDGTILAELNDPHVFRIWIEGAKVKVKEGAQAQAYPGLSWEIVSVDRLKVLALSKLENYVDGDDYGEYQKPLLDDAISNGAAAINAADDDEKIDAALYAAEEAIDDIPTSEEIYDARSDVWGHAYEDKEYNEYQDRELEQVLEEAFSKIEKVTSDQELLEAVMAAEERINKIPTSEEVADADEAKKELKEEIVRAENLMAQFDYTKDSLEALKQAIADARDVYAYEDAFAADVLEIQKELDAAEVGLEIANNKEKNVLLDTLIRAQKISKEEYQTNSYAALQKEMDAADKLIADPYASLEDLRDANTAVLKAIKGLVVKSGNPMQISVKNKTVKAKKVRAKAVVVKEITVKKAIGKVTYLKDSGSKNLSVNKTNGKIKVKKGTKKGKYTAKVKVIAAGDGNYQAKEQIVTVKVYVK